MPTIDIINVKTRKPVVTFRGKNAWRKSWEFYGQSHICPYLPKSAPRREFTIYTMDLK